MKSLARAQMVGKAEKKWVTRCFSPLYNLKFEVQWPSQDAVRGFGTCIIYNVCTRMVMLTRATLMQW